MLSLRLTHALAALCLLAPAMASADDADRNLSSDQKIATAPPPSDVSPSVTNDGREPYGKTQGVLGPVVLGPKITGIAFPNPFRLGVEGKWDNLVGLSFDYGFFPKLTFSSVSVSMNGWQITGRVFPWKRAFFVGLGMGSHTASGSKTELIAASGQTTTATLDMKSTFLAPHIGWRWTWNSGFWLGLELGAQIPVGNSSTFTSDANATTQAQTQYQQLVTDITTKANDFGNKALPQFALVQLGYFF